MILRLAIIAGIGLFGAQAAAGELPALPEPSQAHQHYSAVGFASWYGSELHGHPTADGEIFDMRSISAAHRTMPLPCYARVTNLRNGRSIVVRVNDRGPFVRGRIVDVSARVAKLLEFNGLEKVRLDYIGKALPAGSDGPALLASLQTGGRPAAAQPAPPAGSVGQALLADLRNTFGPHPAAPAAPPAARPEPDEGVSVVARVVDRPPATEPHSPFGDLLSSPFLAKASWP